MKKGYAELAAHLAREPACRQVPTPEGEFIVVFNPRVEKWVSRHLTKEAVHEISQELTPSLEIPLTAEGFARAADRKTNGSRDEMHYDTVWVRDAMWVFFALRECPERRRDAHRLLLAVWDYYASPAQIRRFEDVIADPRLAVDMMRVPHIRFDVHPHGPDDVMADNGRPQVWNHRQNDAHGLFLIALAEAVRDGMVGPADLSEERWNVLIRFPAFFKRICFESCEDAGAWEELERRNTSSIGLVTRAMEAWRRLLFAGEGDGAQEPFRARFLQLLEATAYPWKRECRAEALSRMIAGGLRTVRHQIALGGESPDYDPYDVRFRGPMPLCSPSLFRRRWKGFGKTNSGRCRHRGDPPGTRRDPALPERQLPVGELLDPAAGEEKRGPAERRDGGNIFRDAFMRRGERLIPGTEAQWFFDSILALARLQLASMSPDGRRRDMDRFLATVHLKRALGQLTGSFGTGPVLAANGEILEPLLPPESINTVIIEGRSHWLPSPITPLNWARRPWAWPFTATSGRRFHNIITGQGKTGTWPRFFYRSFVLGTRMMWRRFSRPTALNLSVMIASRVRLVSVAGRGTVHIRTRRPPYR